MSRTVLIQFSFNQILNDVILLSQADPNENREVLVFEVSLKRYLDIWRLCFHPANFDNFKDDKMTDYKTY